MREFDTHTPPSCSTHMCLKSAKYERLTPTQLWDLEYIFFDEKFSGNLLKSLCKFIGKWREMKVKIMRIFAALEDVELFLEMKIAKIVLDYEVRLWALYRIQFWSRLEKFWGFSELDFWIGSQHQMKFPGTSLAEIDYNYIIQGYQWNSFELYPPLCNFTPPL